MPFSTYVGSTANSISHQVLVRVIRRSFPSRVRFKVRGAVLKFHFNSAGWGFPLEPVKWKMASVRVVELAGSLQEYGRRDGFG